MQRKTKTLTALAVAALFADLGTGVVPVDFRLIPAGEFRPVDGRKLDCGAWVMQDEDGQRIVAEASARVSPYVIDYEHATLKAKQTGQQAPAAGWYKQLEWRPGDGLYALGVDWTALAAQMVAGKEYRYISPVFSYDPVTGRVQKLLFAALTNDPGLDGLTDLAALFAQYETDLLSPPDPLQETFMDLLKKLLAALGLQETASETEALSAVAALKTNVAALSAQVSQPDPARFVPIAALSALQGEHAEVQNKLAALQAEVDGGKLDQVVAAGLAAGKITPATEAWARDLGKSNLASLSSFIEAAPVIVVPGVTQTKGQGEAGQAGQLTPAQLAICTATGVDPKAFLATLQAEVA